MIYYYYLLFFPSLANYKYFKFSPNREKRSQHALPLPVTSSWLLPLTRSPALSHLLHLSVTSKVALPAPPPMRPFDSHRPCLCRSLSALTPSLTALTSACCSCVFSLPTPFLRHSYSTVPRIFIYKQGWYCYPYFTDGKETQNRTASINLSG